MAGRGIENVPEWPAARFDGDTVPHATASTLPLVSYQVRATATLRAVADPVFFTAPFSVAAPPTPATIVSDVIVTPGILGAVALVALNRTDA